MQAQNWFHTLARAGAEYFIIRAVPEGKGKVWSARVPAEKAIDELFLRYLGRLNAERRHIYARPEGYRFVLVDDIKDAERVLPYRPVLIVETSPGNHQAWYALAEMPADRENARMICRSYAVMLRGDPGSAEPDHLGRVAGFTNWKRRYAPEHPIARIIYAKDGAVARTNVFSKRVWRPTPTSGDRIIHIVRDIFHRNGWNIPRQRKSFSEHLIDRSARDFAYAAFVFERELERRGIVREQAIKRIREHLYEKSSKAVERGDEYVARTITAAWRFVVKKRTRGYNECKEEGR